MLDALEIDYLGVSLDALLVVTRPEDADAVIDVVQSTGVTMKKIGYVTEGPGDAKLVTGGEMTDFIPPRFRESAYTPPVKKVVDTTPHDDFEAMKKRVARAGDAARDKKERVLAALRQAE